MYGNLENNDQPEPNYTHSFKSNFNQYINLVILVGESSVGKTSLLSKYVRGIFPSISMPTIALEFCTKLIQMKDGTNIKVQIWDTGKYLKLVFQLDKKNIKL